MESQLIPTPGRLKEDVQLIKEWLSKQPHLPKVEDEEWLTAILHHNKYSVEKTKKKLDNYFSYRVRYPEVLKNRDPTGPEILRTMGCHKIVIADKLSKDDELIMFNVYQTDTDSYDIRGSLKLLYMLCDTLFLEHDRHSHIVVVTDCRHLSYLHFLKSVPWLKPMVDIFFKAYSDRVKAFYVMNAPANLDIVFNTIKGLLPKKIGERFYVYPSVENLCKLVDENVVCSDMGGKGPSLAHYEEYTMKRLEKYKDWFSEQENVHANEELRRTTDKNIERMQGSFRKLEVD